MKTPRPSKAEQSALQKTAGELGAPASGLNEQNIPSHLLPLEDYLNAELREHLQKHEVQHGI